MDHWLRQSSNIITFKTVLRICCNISGWTSRTCRNMSLGAGTPLRVFFPMKTTVSYFNKIQYYTEICNKNEPFMLTKGWLYVTSLFNNDKTQNLLQEFFKSHVLRILCTRCTKLTHTRYVTPICPHFIYENYSTDSDEIWYWEATLKVVKQI